MVIFLAKYNILNSLRFFYKKIYNLIYNIKIIIYKVKKQVIVVIFLVYGKKRIILENKSEF